MYRPYNEIVYNVMSELYENNTLVCDLPRFLVNYAHVQTVDTRPTFHRGGRCLGTRLHFHRLTEEASDVVDTCTSISTVKQWHSIAKQAGESAELSYQEMEGPILFAPQVLP